ncbi:MAG: mechanosensitive ion channel family protein [Pseudomonadota bacterium]
MENQDNKDSALQELLPVDAGRALAEQVLDWIQTNLFNLDVAIQLGLMIGAIVPAALFGQRLSQLVREQLLPRVHLSFLNRLVRAISVLAVPIVLYLTLTIINIALRSAGQPTEWVGAAIALMNAWILVRIVTLVIQSPFWSRFAFFVAWPIAALDAFGALGPVVEQMRALSIPLGENDMGQPVDISLFDVIRTLIYFGVLFAGANILSKVLQQQIEQIDELSPSLKALLGKVLNVVLPIIALLIAFQIVGFNVATLAVFSGAVGLGVGLGLQRIIANFVAGFTLIADKSIKPGDVIEIDGTMGWITSMQARYVAVRTRDGTELLIPNDRFMSEGLINWSRSDEVIRLHAPFGVSYRTRDLRAVQALAVKAATRVGRVIAEPSPVCNLVEYGDSSVNFDLRFWIRDPQNGLTNVRSDVMLEIWDDLHAAGIEVPFPQRDLHIKSWAADAMPPRD